MKTTKEERALLRGKAGRGCGYVYSRDIENKAILNLLDDIDELQEWKNQALRILSGTTCNGG